MPISSAYQKLIAMSIFIDSIRNAERRLRTHLFMPSNVEIERRFLVDVVSLPRIRELVTSAVEIRQWFPPLGEVELLPETHSIALSGRVMIERIPEEEWVGVCELISSGIGIRIRLIEGKGVLTVKGPWEGVVRKEFEWPVDPVLVKQFGDAYEWPGISKRRLYYPLDNNMVCEVDVFSGPLDGLVIAEVELESGEEKFTLPEWFGTEVTGAVEWGNAALAKK